MLSFQLPLTSFLIVSLAVGAFGATTTSSSLCCQSYEVPGNPTSLTLCGPTPTSTARTITGPPPPVQTPPPGLNTTLYYLCTAHCAGKSTPGVPETSTVCPQSCSYSTTYGTGAGGTTTGYTVTNPDIEGTGACPGPWPTTTSSGSLSVTTTALPAQTHWGQCGGAGYQGPSSCGSPYTCSAVAPTYYSQCL
ncbi:hypothetical protein SISSUDRAFT_132326 [Sistotremastrum suecicum HHB10207 ss-3]|uniref:CBM1 domain-containing protein n=1 Tax=Sistotremastrum suecicum HHB10207 ss-3 TaxID=1314776 RepID=A0A166AXQ6_9AGAM|nr:hypothetical protein SISSUDRAFT_132326 [Sistotremastrum suecicum HHB10207 ss-3]